MTDSALGVTVTDPLARTNARVAAAEAGSSLSKVFDRKVQRAAAACQQPGLVFLPLAVETLRGMHKVEAYILKVRVSRVQTPPIFWIFCQLLG